jgi:hypothetical protein
MDGYRGSGALADHAVDDQREGDGDRDQRPAPSMATSPSRKPGTGCTARPTEARPSPRSAAAAPHTPWASARPPRALPARRSTCAAEGFTDGRPQQWVRKEQEIAESWQTQATTVLRRRSGVTRVQSDAAVRSRRRRRLSSRPSSTGHQDTRSVHRRVQEGVRGRADRRVLSNTPRNGWTGLTSSVCILRSVPFGLPNTKPV